MTHDSDLEWLEPIHRSSLEIESSTRVSEWASLYRHLPETSAQPGRWRNEITPYLVAIMDDLAVGSPIEIVIFKKCAQIRRQRIRAEFRRFCDPCRARYLTLHYADLAIVPQKCAAPR